jgi:hypothetical protein
MRRALAWIPLAMGVVCACGRDAGPVEPATVAAITVGVEPNMVVGQQAMATVTLRDGAGAVLVDRRVVTWQTTDANVATVDGTGLVTARSPGSVMITAASEGRSGSAQTQVSRVPYVIAGIVTTRFTDTPIAGAALRMLDGLDQNRTAVSDAQGRFRVENLRGRTAFSIEATAPGHWPDSLRLTPPPDESAGPVQANHQMRQEAAVSTSRGTGVVVNAITGEGLTGVIVQATGLAQVTSGAGGLFAFSAAEPPVQRPITFQSPMTVTRTTTMHVPGAATVVPLIPTTFNLAAFDEGFRNAQVSSGGLWRWTSAPVLIVQRAVLLEQAPGALFLATSVVRSQAVVDSLIKTLTFGLSQLTPYQAFAEVRVETAAPGALVSDRATPGAIIVGWLRPAAPAAAAGFGSIVAELGNRIRSGWAFVNYDWETRAGGSESSTVGAAFTIWIHELGHALGRFHVTLEKSIMGNGLIIPTVPTEFDRQAGRISFTRPPGNRSPDNDPPTAPINSLQVVASPFGEPTSFRLRRRPYGSLLARPGDVLCGMM